MPSDVRDRAVPRVDAPSVEHAVASTANASPTPPSRWKSALAWCVWFVHYPTSLLWVAIAVIVIAGVVELFRSPREALGILGSAAALAGMVEGTARRRGVHAWPWRRED